MCFVVVSGPRYLAVWSFAMLTLQQQQPWPGIERGNDYHQATNFPIPPDEWPPDVPLDAACDHYRNPTSPLIATLYPLSLHHSIFASTGTPELKGERRETTSCHSPCRLRAPTKVQTPRRSVIETGWPQPNAGERPNGESMTSNKEREIFSGKTRC